MKYDTAYLEDYIAKLSRQIETLTLTRSDYYTTQAWNSAKILTFQIEDEQMKLETYRKLLEDGAVMTSTANGSYAAVQDSGLTSEDTIVNYTNKELYEGQIVRMG